ncbi:LamG-like jellyroll fold domain-containing protein, partial [Fibrobacterota bacterium]
ERADPQGTTYQLNVTPGAGYYALVTDGRGGSDSYYDVDGGETAIQSPQITLPSSGDITISFFYYMGHRYDAEDIDYFRVKIKVGSNETVILEELAGDGEDQPSSYESFSTSLNSFTGQTIRVLIEAADNSGTLLEASVDELKIESDGGGGSVTQAYETPNYPSNYPNNVNETVTIGKDESWGGTTYQIEVIGESEANYDYLYLKQGGQNICDPIHGNLGAEGLTVDVSNDDPVDVTFTSDGSVTRQGFHVEAIEGSQPPVDDMVAHLKMDEGSGSNLADATGNGHNGTIHNNAAWTNNNCPELDDALSFDEVNDYVTVSDFNYTADNEFTLSFWFNISNNTGSYYKYIFSHGAVSTANSMNIYFYEDGNSYSPRLRTNLQDANNLPGSSALDINEDFADGNWHLYTLTVSSGNIIVFIDGEEKATSTSSFGSYNPGTALYIGARENLNSYRFYGGLVDDFRIYNYSLNENEVGDLIGTCGEPPVTVIEPNSIRIAYSHDSGDPDPINNPVLARAYHIPDDFLARAKRNGYNYILFGFWLVSEDWDNVNGSPVDHPNSNLRDKLQAAFEKVDSYGMRLIPLFQMANSHSMWQWTNENIEFNNNNGKETPQIAPDAHDPVTGQEHGLDYSYGKLIETIANAFNEANLPYDLEYIHLGHDEIIAIDENLDPSDPNYVRIAFGQCNADEAALTTLISGGKTTEQAHLELLADEIERRVDSVNVIFNRINPGSPTPKVMIYACMLDKNWIGGWTTLNNYINNSTIQTAKTLDMLSVQDDLILMPWVYYSPHPWVDYPNGGNYDTYGTLKSFNDAGYMFIYTFGLSGSLADWDNPTLYQLGQWYHNAFHPDVSNKNLGFCSVHWNYSGDGPLNGEITENHWK